MCAKPLQSCPTLCDVMDCSPLQSLQSRLFCPWDSPAGRHPLLQGIFPTQGLNLVLGIGRQILYCLNHQGRLVVEIYTNLWESVSGLLAPSFLGRSEREQNQANGHLTSRSQGQSYTPRGSSLPKQAWFYKAASSMGILNGPPGSPKWEL